ncbi:hypothetical protein MZK49_18180 [Ensifer sesbaniae]|uniref:hypothetical protein n=1 Tax=Ensifer sesbaniae TaxID=1214071 RepID=UPI0015680D7C|nr:hypothetical protein [Ensifer sesbaniae]MCK3778633.1 hypothetical protein [Ensifer sesbaniae]NRQ16950.1 hypothetical protein [Ensifer sesbaniae]
MLDRDISTVCLPDGAGALRVIAGSYAGAHGSARNFTPDRWDLRLKRQASLALDLPEGHSAGLAVPRGNVLVNRGYLFGEAICSLRS